MVFKKSTLILLLLLTFTVSISGCTTTKNATNGTFGEKVISLNNITIVNNVTADHYQYGDVNYYYITGYIKNKNKYDVFNLKMKATAFDAEGNVVAINDSVYLNPKVLSPNSDNTYFFFSFVDNDEKIVRYDIQLINADAEV